MFGPSASQHLLCTAAGVKPGPYEVRQSSENENKIIHCHRSEANSSGQLVWMYYASGTVDRIAASGQPVDATYAAGDGHEMMSWPPSWKCDILSKIWFDQLTIIYMKNNPAKYHPDPIWNDRALGFYEHGRPNKKMSKDMRSAVPDPTTTRYCLRHMPQILK